MAWDRRKGFPWITRRGGSRFRLEYEEYSVIAVAAHHIDTNHHVNNAQYVEIAREVIAGRTFHPGTWVEYKKAAVLGDQIIPRVSVEDEVLT